MKLKKFFEYTNQSQIWKKERILKKLSRLGSFITYDLGMKSLIDKLLKEMTTSIDYNSEYQVPLSILHRTGKFPDIKKEGDIYTTDKLKSVSLVKDSNGKWDPVNKLNTNHTDLSELLTDIFEVTNSIEEVDKISSDQELKNWLMNFRKENDLSRIIKDNNIDLKKYINANRKFSIWGEEAENKISNIIKSKNLQILYQGGDGDLIDMIYGSDLIVGNGDKIYLVQVKSKEEAAKKALTSSQYSKLDWFCAPKGENSMIVFSKGNPDGKLVTI